MKARYKNPWHKPLKPMYGPEFYETEVDPIEYRGYLIYERLPAVFDIVRDGVCLSQYAGLNGAKGFIDTLLKTKENFMTISTTNTPIAMLPGSSIELTVPSGTLQLELTADTFDITDQWGNILFVAEMGPDRKWTTRRGGSNTLLSDGGQPHETTPTG
jgi:hypothetical protein